MASTRTSSSTPWPRLLEEQPSISRDLLSRGYSAHFWVTAPDARRHLYPIAPTACRGAPAGRGPGCGGGERPAFPPPGRNPSHPPSAAPRGLPPPPPPPPAPR